MTDLYAAVAAALRDHAAPAAGLNPEDVELVAVEDGMASVRLSAACSSCGGVQPLILQLEAELKRHVPAVEFVEAVA